MRNRLKGVKGSIYLTHGSDDHDHRGLKKALRATGRDLIAEGLQDLEGGEVAQITGKLTYRLVIFTQVYENYGYRWKAKGGSEYHLPIENVLSVTGTRLKAMVDAHRGVIERIGGDDLHDSDERIVDWGIFSSAELTPEEAMEADYWYGMSAEEIAHAKRWREGGWLERAAQLAG